VDFAVGISYSADIDTAKNVLKETAMAEPRILKDEEVFVFIKELAASQVTVGIRVWTKNEDYWTVYFNLNEAFKKALDKEGIEIPYNQLSVHIEK
jgi:small conductance mechanosensitive channel